uniref:hypothetical protein n=1 Tax=uncultured Acinetobacter sp. TaxID=165433 RepID=UPI0026134EED|nr:hypothetical protein [uncultured Acinetobacter sp.]
MKTLFASTIFVLSSTTYSATKSVYKSVYTGESYTRGNSTYQNKQAQIRDRVLGETRPDPYAQPRNNPYNRYPIYPDYYPNHLPNGYPHDFPNGHGNHGTQVYIGTPHVQIHVQPETQTHYQSTEEVYLPYGGTYRKTTESIAKYPAYSQYGYPYSNTQNKRTYGKVIQQGKY